MSNSRAIDYDWQAQYMAQARAIIEPYLLVPASLERDRHEVADLVVPAWRSSVAVRLRRAEGNYPHNQFTVRAEKQNGTKTELTKIVDGHGHAMLYGHAGAGVINPWLLICLHALRAAFQRYPAILHSANDNSISGCRDSGDGGTFRWFDVDKLPADVLIARSLPPTPT